MNRIVKADLEYITSDQTIAWELFAGATIFISGANGFLPAYLVETLLYLNDHTIIKNKLKVIGLVRNEEKARKRFQEYLNRMDFELIVQDIAQPLKIDAKLDYIIHAASQASPKYYGGDPVGTLVPNVLGTYNMLNLAKEKNSQVFLFFSSGEVYGEVDAEHIPTREEDYGYINPLDVRACYAESKRMGETMCLAWSKQFAVPAKIIRPFHTYGPGMQLDDGRVFADFVSDIVHNRNIVMKSDGSARRAFCYLADATLGFITVLLAGKVGEAYNVGNNKAEISIKELAEMLITIFPEKKLKVIMENVLQNTGYLKSKITRNCPDISKVGLLGWTPKTAVREGFARTINSFL